MSSDRNRKYSWHRKAQALAGGNRPLCAPGGPLSLETVCRTFRDWAAE